ncbi:hypothetical protein CARUB_v10022437mg [Capsella rubella]|uniref:Uncharacterized protein n=1 Tax=Capsella rubella TaxID=81985 RepID=R0GGL7_9BRAS|nr:hypothetical protein CARUB_v10022437mg [Capsella rubella]
MTEREPFYRVNGTTVSVPFMSSSHKQSRSRSTKFRIESGFEASSYFNNFELDVSMYQKAYACTGFHVPLCGCSLVRPMDFVANHPIVFLIREYQTGTGLFAGQIFDPSALDRP